MKKLLLPTIVLLVCGFASLAFATSTFSTQQGGTGTTTPSGILYGDNGATSHVNTVTIGAGLTFSGGVLTGTSQSTFGTTSLSAVAPLQYSQSPLAQFSITQAGTGSNGYLSSADFNTFNNKQNAIALGAGTVNSSASNVLYVTATSTVSVGTGITYSGTMGSEIGGISGTLTNTGVISNSCPGGFLTCSGTNPSTFSLGTLTVPNGGTGATTFGQGWLFSTGGTGALAASTSPTVNYLTATSTTATSTFAYSINATSGAVATNNVYLARPEFIYSTTTPSTANVPITVVFSGARDAAPSFSGTTLTFPSNTYALQVEARGAGGSGGDSTSPNPGGGGGGGGYARKLYTLPLATKYFFDVGTGAASTTFSNPGNTGGNTDFGTGSATTTGNGGLGGLNTSIGGGVSGGNGGSATGGDINLTGQSGAAGATDAPGSVNFVFSGGGGGEGGASGRGGVCSALAGGFAGTNGGGGSGCSNGFSGTGGNGYIVFTIYTY